MVIWIFRLNALGLLGGAVLFAASLSPSLVPRDFLFQGVLGGTAFALGYWFGMMAQAVWLFLEMPVVPPRIWRALVAIAAAVSALTSILALSRAAEWQNSIRVLVGMEEVQTAHPIYVAVIALISALVLMALFRVVFLFFRALSLWFYARAPRRISFAAGVVTAAALVGLLANGLVMRVGMSALDDMFRYRDLLIDPATPKPTDPLVSGSAQSLISWELLGATGRNYVNETPTQDDIALWQEDAAMTPLRIYVGLNAAETVEERAKLALAELQRVGGFERSVLVVATPTGTGWMDSAAFDTLDILHGGDVATVAMQYSYLSSYVSMMVEPDISAQSARALFVEVYNHWRTLPAETRPELYLFGLSLGSYGSEFSAGLHEMLSDPIQGALWAGPPFLNRIRQDVTRGRNQGSPAWLPEFGDGSLVRFKNQFNDISDPDAGWGPIRIVYLQYASDPVVFFDPASFYRRPEWLEQRGPDVSPRIKWVPGVTFLQLLVDMANSLVTPLGYGHYYAHRDYIDSWVAVTAPPGWSEEKLDRLKASFLVDHAGG